MPYMLTKYEWSVFFMLYYISVTIEFYEFKNTTNSSFIKSIEHIVDTYMD
jgi:hypothetical protein